MYTTPWSINIYSPGELLQTSEVLVLSLKSLAMDILVCEVQQPPRHKYKIL
jgi:hypothetical protein